MSDRFAAENWYGETLGFKRVLHLESWAAGGGPLTLADESGNTHLALFEKLRKECRSTIALGCSGAEFLAWQVHLQSELGREIEAVDHELSWSLYFEDPDANPFEITSYEYRQLSASLHGAGA